MSSGGTSTFADIAVPVNPFPGLRSFELEESHLFFGRDGQSEQLISKLGRSRFVAVVGTSGSGKSSLVRAGLLPSLLGGFMVNAHSAWRIAIMRPGNDPLGNLARALHASGAFGASDNGNAAIQTAVTEATLRRGSRGLVDAVRPLSLLANENLLVLVDQFEEIFRFGNVAESEDYENEAAAFVKLILEASRQREASIYVALTMRSDYLGDCSRFWELPEAINESQYLIPRLTRNQLREAIVGPIAVGGGTITPRLLNRLLNDVGDNQDQLPILQHALMRTWDKWKEERGGLIDVQHYEAIGGMAEALSRHAGEAFNELADDRSREVAEKVFKALTEKGPDNREIRRPITLRELWAVTSATENEVAQVIETFRQPGRSFLMPPANMQLDAESLIDISHESLIRGWRRLKEWVEEEADSARIYRRLAETAELNRQGRAGLWGDPDLSLALDWREKSKPNERWALRYHPGFDAAMVFVESSRQQRDREIVEKQKQQRLMRRMTAALFSLSLLALIGFTYLVHHAREVNREAEEFRQKTLKEADAQVGRAHDEAFQIRKEAIDSIALEKHNTDTALESANKERAAASTNHQMALAMRIATQAADEFKRGNLTTSGALAIESLNTSDSFVGRRSLAELLRITPPVPEIIRRGPGSPVDSVAYSHDSKWIAWATRDGRVVISDLSGRKADVVLPTDQPAVMSLAFSHDDQILAAGIAGGLWLWEVATGKLVQEPIRNIGNPHVVTFGPDGKYLAAWGGNQIWLFQRDAVKWKGNIVPASRDLPTIRSIAFLRDGSLVIAGSHSIAFMDVSSLKLRVDTQNDRVCHAVNVSPDLRWLVVGCGREVLIADMTTQDVDVDPKVPRPFLFYDTMRLENVDVTQIAIGNDGKYLAARDNNSSEVHVYDVATKEECFRIIGPLPIGIPGMPFNFRPDGKVLAAGLQDGSVAAWHLTKGNEALRWQYHGIVSGLAFSPDKKWLAAVTFDDNASNGSVRILQASGIQNFRPVRTFQFGKDLRKPFFSPDSRFLGVFDSKGLHLVQTNPWKSLAQHDLRGEFSLAAFSPNGRVLVTLSRHDEIRRFFTTTWSEMKRVITGEFGNGFKFSPDGRLLATSGDLFKGHTRSRVEQVWDLNSGIELAWRGGPVSPEGRAEKGGSQHLLDEAKNWTAVRHDSLLRSPDNRWVARTGESEVELIATDFGTVEILGHDDTVLDTAFSPDGRWLLTSSMDKTVRLWPLTVNDLTDRACKLFPWNLNQEEWNKMKLERPYHRTCRESELTH